MKLKILDTAHHRNGVAGAPFDVVLFDVQREPGVKVAVLFDELRLLCRSRRDPAGRRRHRLRLQFLAGRRLRAGLRSDPSATDRSSDPGTAGAYLTDDATIPQRVERCEAALRHYSDDDCFTSLIDLLADAMHWCDATGEDFHYALCVAGRHYLAELNDQPTTETETS